MYKINMQKKCTGRSNGTLWDTAGDVYQFAKLHRATGEANWGGILLDIDQNLNSYAKKCLKDYTCDQMWNMLILQQSNPILGLLAIYINLILIL